VVSDYRASTTRGIGTIKITEEEDKIYNEDIDQQDMSNIYNLLFKSCRVAPYCLRKASETTVDLPKDMSNRYYSMYIISRRYSSSSGIRKWMENMNK
jgi:hypothetical protein